MLLTSAYTSYSYCFCHSFHSCYFLPPQDLSQCLSLWQSLRGAGDKWSAPWALAALAAVQRTELALAAFSDSIYSLVQPHAARFGDACKLDPKVRWGRRGQIEGALNLGGAGRGGRGQKSQTGVSLGNVEMWKCGDMCCG